MGKKKLPSARIRARALTHIEKELVLRNEELAEAYRYQVERRLDAEAKARMLAIVIGAYVGWRVGRQLGAYLAG